MEHEDIIHRLQIIRDQIRYGKTFDADVKLDSLQRMIAEEKLTSDNSEYMQCQDTIVRNEIKQCRECGRPL